MALCFLHGVHEVADLSEAYHASLRSAERVNVAMTDLLMQCRLSILKPSARPMLKKPTKDLVVFLERMVISLGYSWAGVY